MKHAAVFAITGVLAGSVAGVAQQAAHQPAAAYTYQGTVHSVQPKTGTLELVTGVGLALRLVQMRVPTGLRETQGKRSEEHTSELQSQSNLVCRLLLEKKKKKTCKSRHKRA